MSDVLGGGSNPSGTGTGYSMLDASLLIYDTTGEFPDISIKE